MEAFELSLRQMIELVLQLKPYAYSDVLSFNVIKFLTIVSECNEIALKRKIQLENEKS